MDNSFWTLIALLVFFGVVFYVKGFRRINQSLDERSKRIRTELEEARELKEEAKQQLAEYQRRRREAEQEAQDIIEAAKREAQQMLAETAKKNKEFVERRTAMAEDQIAQAEADARKDIRTTAVDIAVAAAAKVISQREGTGQSMSDSIAAVRQRLN
ncbi:F0F1 ATP synthase subunit B' [Fulvimarina pelagi HTCC2506]|uniref:ATP synthase subunit b n=1 Tax=Fulvimarina pelagi HTCC2506 TaxID=314231 RepID=Q0G572_9HYPH|nr:F0F1 ATP synthase subunit B [Fulvimarina pelagi]EAU43192.1 F0F1 ATP synthase subunit B' [Fulvimarina pelagi HTCC2506]